MTEDEMVGVLVWVQVGKEFPDMRQNERGKNKFIRLGEAVRTVGQLKGEQC